MGNPPIYEELVAQYGDPLAPAEEPVLVAHRVPAPAPTLADEILTPDPPRRARRPRRRLGQK